MYKFGIMHCKAKIGEKGKKVFLRVTWNRSKIRLLSQREQSYNDYIYFLGMNRLKHGTWKREPCGLWICTVR